jgi:hypothetical protein
MKTWDFSFQRKLPFSLPTKANFATKHLGFSVYPANICSFWLPFFLIDRNLDVSSEYN